MRSEFGGVRHLWVKNSQDLIKRFASGVFVPIHGLFEVHFDQGPMSRSSLWGEWCEALSFGEAFSEKRGSNKKWLRGIVFQVFNFEKIKISKIAGHFFVHDF